MYKWFAYHHYILNSESDYKFTFTSEFYTFMFYVVKQHPFISAWRTSFSISYKCMSGMMNFFSFCLSEKIFILPSFQKDSMLGIVFLVGSFLLSIFWYIIPISVQSFCWEIWWPYEVCLYFTTVFFPVAFKILIFDFWQFDYVSCCESLWVYPVWSLLNLLNTYVHFFPWVWDILVHYCFK